MYCLHRVQWIMYTEHLYTHFSILFSIRSTVRAMSMLTYFHCCSLMFIEFLYVPHSKNSPTHAFILILYPCEVVPFSLSLSLSRTYTRTYIQRVAQKYSTTHEIKSQLFYFIALLAEETENEERMYARIYFRIHLIEKLVHFAIMICSLSTRQKRINVNVRERWEGRGRKREIYEQGKWRRLALPLPLAILVKKWSSRTMKFFFLSLSSSSFRFSPVLTLNHNCATQ